MRITRIERESRLKKRYQIFVNEQTLISVHEDTLIKHNLHKGMEVNQHTLRDVMKADERNQVRLKALRYLSYRPRTCNEVRIYLAKLELNPDDIEHMIAELKDCGYLDDRKYAHAWVKERKRNKGYGWLKVKQELKAKGISDRWIEEVHSQFAQEEQRQLAMEIAERRYLRIQHDPWPKIERKLGQYLQRRGFSLSEIYDVLAHIRAQNRIERE
ncbi:RecX family transcriptional regulator [Hazenella sp. IB182353]|uniref:RecX family transcriptional regulator n=1 Tax=Polycladospora coralii TaxID=2771432 RepID=UPI001746075A|nr:RecX family transcriptional regulator [Polycladospora coralii]MBS7530844.1 RecX family transcriptional regulator [Polycladospora coralii]